MQPIAHRSKKTVLVTGGTGFIGLHLCRHLVSAGERVHAISRSRRSNEDSIQWWQGDLSDLPTTERLLRAIEPDLIYHLTGHPWGGSSIDLVIPTLQSDLVAAVNLLTVATQIKVPRIILAGSMEESQPIEGEFLPSGPYAVAKWASRTYARMFHQLYQTPVVIARIFMTYGPGQARQKLIPYVTRSFLRGEIPNLTAGERLIDWIYVSDVIEGLCAVAEAEGVDGKTIDLGSGTLVSVREIVERIVTLLGTALCPQFGALPARCNETIRAAQVQEAYRQIGWEPKTSLDRGLMSTISWCRRELDPASN